MNIWFLRVCGLIALGGVLRQSVALWGSINAAMLLLLCCFLTVIERQESLFTMYGTRILLSFTDKYQLSDQSIFAALFY